MTHAAQPPAAVQPRVPVARAASPLTFRAMCTTVVVRSPSADAIAKELLRLEALLTRFRDSSVTRLNAAGRLSDPPEELVAALSWAVEAARLTDGLVTPLVGRSLEWHGYRESWSEGVAWRAPEGEAPPVPEIEELRVSPQEIVLPTGAAIDLGGTAKSWAVERVAERSRRRTSVDADLVIDAGGDVLIRSATPTQVDILGAAEEWHIDLPPGEWAVATSSVARRAWNGAHHLIDPRTGRPAHGRWVQATVVGASLKLAELATKLLLLGAPVPPALLVEQVWVVDHDGVLR